jgi:hypothetical protein
MKLAPSTVIAWPAVPFDGLSDEMTGAAPGVGVGRVVDEAPRWCVVEWCVVEWCVVDGAAAGGGVFDVGWCRVAAMTTRMMAATATRAAVTNKAIVSRRSLCDCEARTRLETVV